VKIDIEYLSTLALAAAVGLVLGALAVASLAAI
jgi:hypothetical protein